MVKLAKCCNPLPGDAIVGYITRGRGVSVHRSDCPNICEFVDNIDRLIDVSWSEAEKGGAYIATLEIISEDRAGLVADLSNAIVDSKAKMVAITARPVDNKTAISIVDIQVQNTEQLMKTIKAIRKIRGILEVKRRKG